MGSLRRVELDALIAETVVDGYGDDEQLTGLYTMIEANLAVPFTTEVFGVEVTARKADLRAGGIVAICHRGRFPAGDRHSGIFRCQCRRRMACGGSRLTGVGPADDQRPGRLRR